ncbi:MAG: AsmA-like C-terminal region-containing protein [Verrucomicrobiota bacterium]|nr:AsmA-like C-terminal region-containing protein [Verrucomicrobiota bacterium]
MAIQDLSLSYLKPQLKIERATLVAGKRGNINMAGLLDFSAGSSLHLALDFSGCGITPFLPADWREKFKAVFNGQTEIDKKLSGEDAANATGNLDFGDGSLTGLPVLDRTAALTHKPEFQRLPINEIKGHFDWRGGRLKVSEFRFLAKGLICAEGDITIEKGEITSTLKVGVAPDALEPIPGAREKVFTNAHDGYCWTTVHVSGPMTHPREDLKPRLLAAAREKIVGKSILPVLGSGKIVLEAIEHLF